MRTSLRACVALATILSLFLPAATSFAAASISVSPTSGTIGSSTTVSGGGFAANTTVRILFDGAGGTQVGSESSDGAGNLPNLAVTVPNITGGAHQVLATDGTNTATTNFVLPSNLVLNPTSGGPGTTINVSGSGFLAGESISVAWDQTSSQMTTATANATGAFTASFQAPNGTGDHQVIATGGTSGFTLATAFSLGGTANVGGATLAINPTSGPAGSQLNLQATGFAASEQVNLAVDGSGVTSVTSDGSGNFTTTITLSSSLGFGDHTISATGVTSGHSASAAFNVTNGRGEERGRVSCTAENTRPGNGFGDMNHCHTGSEGDDHGAGHGHGSHGDNDQDDDS